ncbi:hypothetical protein M569_01751 [Genlisea aurea]|uniref:Uncharacterized protein n=1 Tax=Genlisea aurea TaxID=192259 RepID=S8D0U5_9LAMI|nr:hypothetical protein M569_01751 [Genlisea aurea]
MHSTVGGIPEKALGSNSVIQQYQRMHAPHGFTRFLPQDFVGCDEIGIRTGDSLRLEGTKTGFLKADSTKLLQSMFRAYRFCTVPSFVLGFITGIMLADLTCFLLAASSRNPVGVLTNANGK